MAGPVSILSRFLRCTAVFAGVSGALLFSLVPVQAIPFQAFSRYEFTLIARSGSNGIERLVRPLSLNNAGTVAFVGRTAAENVLYTGDGGTPTEMYSTNVSGPTMFNPIINNAGQVAFGLSTGVSVNRQEGIYLSESPNSATPIITTLQDKGGINFDHLRRVGAPFDDNEFSFNDSGQAAFFGISNGGLTEGIYSVDVTDAPPVTYFNSNLGGIASNLVMNNAGEVATGVLVFPEGWHIGRFTPSGPPGIDIAGPADFSIFSLLNIAQLDMNDAGTVAIRIHNIQENEGIYTSRGNGVTTIVYNDGPFRSFLDPAINNSGAMVFEGSLDKAGGRGIFRGADPIGDKVIAVGDTLFGSRVVFVDMKRDGFNDNGSFSFVAHLADGTEAVVRADRIPFSIDPDLLTLDAFATLSTLTGDGMGMSQAISTPDTLFDISFDIEFLGSGTEVSLVIGEREWRISGARAAGPQHILLEDIDPLSLLNPRSAAGEVLVKFFLPGVDGVVQIDNINIPGLRNVSFDVGYFDFWDFDTSRGGVASINLAVVDVAEPSTTSLLGLGLFSLLWRRKTRRRLRGGVSS